MNHTKSSPPAEQEQSARLPHGTVTGTVWRHGYTQTVTGYPLRRGYATPTVALVDILTESGEAIRDVKVDPHLLDRVRVQEGSSASDRLLRRVVARFGREGLSGRAAAELAWRERARRESTKKARRLAGAR